jgi:AcrR family transcriptional regulator
MTKSEEATGARRRQRSDGERTHAAILEAAMQLASIEGVHGLTIGRLADTLGVSKSGLYAHFGSKEQLQRETVLAALHILEREVVEPALAAPAGVARLAAAAAAFFSYLERWVFPGGCFFASLLAEEDARDGPLHETVVRIEREWLETLAGFGREAQQNGELSAAVDVKQLAFEVYACLELTNFHFVLFRDLEVLERGRTAVRGVLRRARAEARETGR